VVRGSGSPRMSTRETESRTVVGKTLKGKNPRRAPTDDLGLARCGVVAERTPGGSKASKWACRPSTGEPSVFGKWTARAARSRASRRPDSATARNPRPGSCVPVRLRVGLQGKELGACGESDREFLENTALATVEREPARKQEARESGYGSSGRESSVGKFQGRERHERRPRSVGGHSKRRSLATSIRAAC
jgi:hypothetical protein